MIALSTNALVLIVAVAFLAGWILGAIVLRWLDKHAEQDRLSEESEAQTERYREHCALQEQSFRRMQKEIAAGRFRDDGK